MADDKVQAEGIEDEGESGPVCQDVWIHHPRSRSAVTYIVISPVM